MLIAQLSDLHVRVAGNPLCGRVETLDFLDRAVAAFSRFRPRPDLVLLTGDLVDLGLDAEYQLVAERLARLGVPTWVIPGNHDDRAGMRRHLQRHLGKVGEVEPFLSYILESGPLRLVALDTVIPGAPGGRLGPARLDWLDRQLGAAPSKPTVVWMHHPAFRTGIGFMDRIMLEDAAEFSAVIGRHAQVRAVLAGHVHRTIVTRIGSAVAAIAPSTAHQIALDLTADGPETFVFEPPGFLLHQWDGGELRTHQVYLGEHGPAYPFAG